jgi:hypothetical protein
MKDSAFGEFAETDTIPKPDGLGKSGPGHQLLFDACSGFVRCLFRLCSTRED